MELPTDENILKAKIFCAVIVDIAHSILHSVTVKKQ